MLVELILSLSVQSVLTRYSCLKLSISKDSTQPQSSIYSNKRSKSSRQAPETGLVICMWSEHHNRGRAPFFLAHWIARTCTSPPAFFRLFNRRWLQLNNARRILSVRIGSFKGRTMTHWPSECGMQEADSSRGRLITVLTRPHKVRLEHPRSIQDRVPSILPQLLFIPDIHQRLSIILVPV